MFYALLRIGSMNIVSTDPHPTSRQRSGQALQGGELVQPKRKNNNFFGCLPDDIWASLSNKERRCKHDAVVNSLYH